MQFQHFLQTDQPSTPAIAGVRCSTCAAKWSVSTRRSPRAPAATRASASPCPSHRRQRLHQIIKNGKVTRGSIGIHFTQSDSNQARNLLKSNGVNEGVFVQTVVPGGPIR